MLERLVGMAAKRVGSFGPSELTFVLDGMARLQVKAPAAFMTALAQLVIISWLSLLGRCSTLPAWQPFCALLPATIRMHAPDCVRRLA